MIFYEFSVEVLIINCWTC